MKLKPIDFFFNIIFVLLHTKNIAQCDFITNPKKNNEFATSQSRNYFDESYVKNNKEYNRQQNLLPITFHPPPYASLNAFEYWKNKLEESNYNRNTFFDNNGNKAKTTFPKKLNSFDFGRHSFEGNHREHETTKGIYYNNHRYTTSRPFETTSGLRYVASHFIPPPKPIRASVIKLETITRPSYAFPPNDYFTTPKYYSHVESLLNQVLIENLKNQYQFNSDFKNRYENNPFINSPAPVLSKPLSYTTVKPDFSSSFDKTNKDNNNLNSKKFVKGNEFQRYPNSVQDQLPPLVENVKIPYVYETTISSFLNTPIPFTESSHITLSKEHENRNNLVFLPENEDDRRDNIKIGIINPYRLYQSDTLNPEINNVKNNFKYLENSTEGLQEYRAKSIKPDRSSVEVVSNLTANGLSENERGNANIQNYINFYNRRNLIPYETVKLSKFPKSSLPEKSHSVNLNDELSLDVKILKDTNWDGFTTTTFETTVPTTFSPQQHTKDFQILPSSNEALPPRNVTEPSRITPTIQLEIKKVNNFWEIEKENDNASASDNESEVYKINKIATTTVITTETSDIATTTDIFTPAPTTPTTSSIKETTFFFIDATTTPQNLESNLSEGNVFQGEKNKSELSVMEISSKLPQVTEHLQTTAATEKYSTFSKRRNYRRRSKVTVFTTPQPFKEKPVINRSYFSRRQKPNITLAFGNKNIITGRPNYKKDEMLHFSDENGLSKRRRKSGKRRQIYKTSRNTTSEILLANENKFVAYKK